LFVPPGALAPILDALVYQVLLKEWPQVLEPTITAPLGLAIHMLHLNTVLQVKVVGPLPELETITTGMQIQNMIVDQADHFAWVVAQAGRIICLAGRVPGALVELQKVVTVTLEAPTPRLELE